MEHLDAVYRKLIENGWTMTQIDDADIYDLMRLMTKEKKQEVADKQDKSAFNFLP